MQQCGSWPLGASIGHETSLSSNYRRAVGTAAPLLGNEAAYSLKHMEQSAPPNCAGVYDGVGVGQESRANVTVPRILGRIQ